MHLDSYVDDLVAGHERAPALGATLLDAQEKVRMYADPVGKHF